MIPLIELCPKCFAHNPEIQKTSACPYCNWDGDTHYVNDMYKLPVGTILKDRFIIGRVLSEGGSSVTYIAFDTVDDKRFCIKEFYPKFYVHREFKDGKCSVRPNEGKEMTFKIDRQKFMEESKLNAGSDKRMAVKDMFSTGNTVYVLMSADDSVWKSLING
ncbi:MAG: hypothetical protein LBL80_04770 [Ruminococcus sp.]|jgi:hypothetical protein|nr:hypothetical protein [Ruminococcus sp.]